MLHIFDNCRTTLDVRAITSVHESVLSDSAKYKKWDGNSKQIMSPLSEQTAKQTTWKCQTDLKWDADYWTGLFDRDNSITGRREIFSMCMWLALPFYFCFSLDLTYDLSEDLCFATTP